MNLTTRYLGFDLPHPFMAGASPLADDLDTVKRLEDAGSAAIVVRSLFEEQIRRERKENFLDTELPADSYSEALSYFPQVSEFRIGPDRYLEQIRSIKECVGIPVIASLNGVTDAGWLEYATLMQQAGADALEMNFYHMATDPEETGASVENRAVEILGTLKASLQIPVAIKLSPFWSSLSNLAARLDEAGADGLVLFNHFYQPDIDIEALESVPRLTLTDSSLLLLRLRWIAILHGRLDASLAATGGIHHPEDAIKAIMAGAHAIQMVAALLTRGVDQLTRIREKVTSWMEEHDYESLAQMQGSMSQARCPDPAAFERGNYMKILQSWRKD